MARERMIMVRVPDELHKAVRVKAAELGRPISEIARGLLQAWVEGRIETPPPESKPKGK
jgi:plasmid stability protein